MYDDVEYASRRLNNTLVRLKNGDPFYIRETFDNDGIIYHSGSNISKDTDEIVKHEELDLTPVPLGFVNLTKRMTFICRMPMRRDWRQGLHHGNIVTCGAVNVRDVHLNWLIQPIKNQYPNFRRALQDLKNRSSIAFSRDFGLLKGADSVILRYRRYDVGEIKDDVAVLFPNKTFLQQHLDEAVGM